MSHDHLIICRLCGMSIEDVRDCDCLYSPLGYSVCEFCKEERDYEERERKRDVVYKE